MSPRPLLRPLIVANPAADARFRSHDPDAGRPTPLARKRDVPYVPTAEPVVEAMLDLAGVGPADVVYDLGCGDGRVVIAAAKRGARGVGVDIDRLRIRECEWNTGGRGRRRRGGCGSSAAACSTSTCGRRPS